MEKKEKGKKKVKIYFVGLLSSFWALFFGRFLTADVHHWTDELHLLDGTSPLLRDFPQYTVVHEKLPEGRDVHACDVLGVPRSRPILRDLQLRDVEGVFPMLVTDAFLDGLGELEAHLLHHLVRRLRSLCFLEAQQRLLDMREYVVQLVHGEGAVGWHVDLRISNTYAELAALWCPASWEPWEPKAAKGTPSSWPYQPGA